VIDLNYLCPTFKATVEENLINIWERINNFLELEAVDEVTEFVNDLNISEVADLISDKPNKANLIFGLLEFQRAVAVFRVLDFNEQQKIITSLSPNKVAKLLNELAPDDRTAFLEELPSGVTKEFLKLLEPEERKITLSLLGYPEESVGRLMTPDYIDVEPEWNVKQVLDYIRQYGKQVETIDVIYVTDKNGVLLDDIRIRDFLIAEKDTLVSELMDSRYISLSANDDQKETVLEFQNNNRVALPVVDDKNVLLGIVTIDDVLWVAEEEYTEDIQKIGGTEALDEPYLETPILKLIQKRLVWLLILFLGEMFTATAMSYYELEIERAVVLALFIPLIISSGGNTGSQASTLIIQAMALGEVKLNDWMRIFKREIISGLILGTILGLIGFARVYFAAVATHKLDHTTIPISLTVGFSLVGVVLWGTLSGSMLPLFLKRLGLDPAVSSAPFVATLVDITGLVIYFSLALLFLKGILL
jgi:magnesium transporter